MIEVDKGVPMPQGARGRGPGRAPKYPFSLMEVGDSFVMDRIGHALTAGANKRLKPKKFVCRTIYDAQDQRKYRIWRVK